MPAALKKCTWFINQGKAGWSETWYQPTTQSSDAALLAMQSVTPFRQALLVNTAEIVCLRVSDESILGDSLVDFGANSAGYGGTAAPLNQDVPGNALYCRATVGGQRRAVALRGLPDDWIIYDANGAPVFTKLLKAFQAWSAAMQAKGFGLRILNQAAPRKPITQVVIDALPLPAPYARNYLIEAPGHGIAATDANGDASIYMVHAARFSNPSINRANGHSLVNGRWQFVTIPAAGQVTYPPADWLLLTSKAPVGVIDPGYLSGGFVQPKTQTFGQIDPITATRGIIAEKFGVKKTGRAFFVQRGRARVARF